MLILLIIAYFISKFFNDLLKYIVTIPLIHHKNCGYVYLSLSCGGGTIHSQIDI